MDETIRRALETDLIIDITTKGRKTGRSHRNEIWFHSLEGQLYITGLPERRDWYANVVANPEFTFHLKGSVQADLPARATPIRDKPARREILQKIYDKYEVRQSMMNMEEWVEKSPLIHVEIVGSSST